jgi:hypothetical protein
MTLKRKTLAKKTQSRMRFNTVAYARMAFGKTVLTMAGKMAVFSLVPLSTMRMSENDS